MRIKLGLIVVIIVILVFSFWSNKDETMIKQEVVTEMTTTNPSNKKDTKVKPAIKKQAVVSESNASIEQSKFEEPIDIIYRELSIERYSQEPALELASAIKEMYDCGYIKSYDRYRFIRNKNQISSAQHDIYLKYQDNCIEVNGSYPTIVEYNQSDSGARKQDFLWIVMNSPYRELAVKSKNFKKLDPYEQEQLTFELASTIIKSQNSQMLLLFSTIITDELQFLDVLKLPQVLSTLNASYVQMIAEQAAVLMSCDYNNGISCAPSSHFMTVACFENEKACGMDVKSWYKFNHSFSHNQDINKVIAYFKTL